MFATIGSKGALNPVLTGYFEKVFAVLVQSNPKAVFGFVYAYESTIENLLRHLDDQCCCDVLVRCLVFSETVF